MLLWRAPVAVFLYRARPPPCRGRSRSGLSAAAAMAITREEGEGPAGAGARRWRAGQLEVGSWSSGGRGASCFATPAAAATSTVVLPRPALHRPAPQPKEEGCVETWRGEDEQGR